MVPDHGLLFDRRAHNPGPAGGGETGTVKLDAMAIRITDFIAWANAERVIPRSGG
ncbi:hypothetical protein PUR61_03690 [Streptomyces sp. BE20]|uniref:hypothetical protein n=1 Tax=unclassified Streptomyces TaxID=2593676 RepID=UPI002E7754DC|nr:MULTISPECIES: hypothetical protein [unclassified Streptomyces]MED7948814.1 hypothetical protein [Streptomyces sp. BE303]MEE1821303.1 hypothetical protein [Streptomyces sp. BE20]